MDKELVRARIQEIGIIPGVRVASAEHARYAAETLHRAGIPIVEITMTVPEALDVISGLAQSLPEMIVGAGTVLDVETAQRCVNAGARFLTSTGFVPEVVEFARKKGVLVIPGALTPSEVIQAWKAGSDFVKIFPCGPPRRRQLHPGFEGAVSANSIDRHRRRESADRSSLHPGRSIRAGRGQRTNPQ